MKSKLTTELQPLSRTARAESTGIIAVFSGDSGVDKTLAAEALADDLNLKLVRIDLSRVASKFIGETEKNLRNLFDTAEASGAILLFDEADALFGKRTGIKDSHDRYANIEVNYLLQLLEEYRGLAILSTQLKSSLDRSVLKQVSHVLDFPRCHSPKCD
jgi:SpoVK/Ycf46/Vps4 family AAA+-type ATPase